MTVEYQKVWRTMNDLELVTSKICSAREIIDAAVDRLQEHQYDKAETMMSAAYEFLEYYLAEFDEKFKDAWNATVGDLRDGDVKKEPLTCDKDDPSPECKGAWNSFWDSYQGSTVSSVQYTEEELNAMCDKAASDEEKEKCHEYNLREAEYYDKKVKPDAEHSEYYYDYTRNDLNRKNPFITDTNFELERIRQEGGYEWTPNTNDKRKKWILPVEECKDVDTDKTEYFVSFPDDLLEAAKLKEGDQVEWVDKGDGSYILRKV